MKSELLLLLLQHLHFAFCSAARIGSPVLFIVAEEEARGGLIISIKKTKQTIAGVFINVVIGNPEWEAIPID